MYRVDGLIDYYYQRKLTGMDLNTIQQSLESQQHIEDEDRSTILQEVLRREELMRKSEVRKKRIIVTTITGVILIALAAFLILSSQ